MAACCVPRFVAGLSSATGRASLSSATHLPVSSKVYLPLVTLLPPLFPNIGRRSFATSVSHACCSGFPFTKLEAVDTATPTEKARRWKPMCLYYTQGKCTMMDDSPHLEKFNHNFSMDLQVCVDNFSRICSPDLDYLLILDLEGKVEILEFPVVVIDAKTANFVDAYHRFVRPSLMQEQRINKYVEGKYGKMGVDRIWHDTAIPFKEVLEDFETWLLDHKFWGRRLGKSLQRAAFVTCGNWDLKTKIPQQCKDSGIKLPSYFNEWINLKDIYLNFYKRRATGMKTMMRELNIPLLGSHHLGLDDSKNIARILQRMIADGALLQITARRRPSSPLVDFLFEDRIR